MPKRILALDLSSSCTGYALLDEKDLTAYGSVDHERSILEYGPYPFCYLAALNAMADKIDVQVAAHKPDVIVIEETNKSRARYSQKALEMLHLLVLMRLQARGFTSDNVKYISTGVWRKATGIELTKEQKKQNSRLSAAKRRAALRGEKLDKAALGISGKVNKKHVAVAFANERFGLTLKQKDNDVADAIGLGLAYALGAAVCNGK